MLRRETPGALVEGRGDLARVVEWSLFRTGRTPLLTRCPIP